MGAGKTTVGELAARTAGVPFRDLDRLIESHAGMTVAEIFVNHGEPGFRAMERSLLPEVLEPETVSALGGGTPMDDANWKLISDRAVSVFLDAPFDSLWARIATGGDRPLVSSRARDELEELWRRRRPRYLQATHIVDADRAPDEVAKEVLRLWST